MPTFTPPTVDTGARGGDRLFDRYTIPVGQSVIRVNGVFQTLPYPWIGELTGAEGTDWFLGGRDYEVTDAVATELAVAGYDVELPPGGYGDGAYGTNGYGI